MTAKSYAREGKAPIINKITLAILLGSDYSQGVYGFGPETASQLVTSIGDDNILQRVQLEGLPFVKKMTRGSKKANALSCNTDKENFICYRQQMAENVKKLGPNEQVLQVINAYLEPQCHLPDSEAVQRACTTYPFLREKLQQICSVSFGWSPHKTDEYILPKIAERDLRRFVNLRRTSLELGADIPLQKMPVPCPVAAIIKQRKLQGRECFEVSWQDMYGFQTSIVSADLIESACPKKVSEFMEKKKMGKRRNSRRERSSKEDTRVDFSGVDFQLKGLHLHQESQSISLPSHSKFLPASAIHAIGSEVIDLSSPSRPPGACKIAKSRQMIHEQMGVIDLCESDTDYDSDLGTSPEHKRKARELRLFLESIRGDL